MRDFPSGPLAKTLCSQRRGPGSHAWSGNEILPATPKSLQATTKHPISHDEDVRFPVLWLRPSTAKEMNQ